MAAVYVIASWGMQGANELVFVPKREAFFE